MLEKFINLSEDSIKSEFNTLTNQQQIELLNEINEKRDSLKENKIVYETELKNLEKKKEEIMKVLQTKYKINNIEEAEDTVAKLKDEIVLALTNFAEKYKNIDI